MWAAGVILYYACTLQYPFDDKNVLLIPTKILSGKYDETPLKNYSENIRRLIRFLFNTDPQIRPSAQQLIDWDFVVKKKKILGFF